MMLRSLELYALEFVFLFSQWVRWGISELQILCSTPFFWVALDAREYCISLASYLNMVLKNLLCIWKTSP